MFVRTRAFTPSFQLDETIKPVVVLTNYELHTVKLYLSRAIYYRLSSCLGKSECEEELRSFSGSQGENEIRCRLLVLGIHLCGQVMV